MDTADLIEAVREAWSGVPAPPAEDLQYVDWGWGEAAERALVGVTPMDVDITSAGFLGTTPLLDIPPRAAAAYLGPYLLSLLRGLSLQEQTGLFHDVITRAHVLNALSQEDFWRDVIRPFLSADVQRTLVDLAHYLASRRDLLGLAQEYADRIVTLATGS